MVGRQPLGRGQDDVRRHNLAAVLGLVHEQGSSTRADLTRALGLNRSTVGDLVGSLVEAGLLVEEKPAEVPGRVGRPSLVVQPRPGAVSVIAAFVDVHELDVARVGLGGHVLGRRREPLAGGASPLAAAQQVATVAEDLLADPGAPQAAGAVLAGVGLAVPGTVHAGAGTIAAAPNLGWHDVPFRALTADVVAARFGADVAVHVANDADLGLLGEIRRGAAVGRTDVVYLCGTYGLGGGVLSGGHPVTGRRGYAGEVGHISVDPSGRACRCGSRGCWESEALAAAWADPLELDADAPDIAEQVLRRLEAGGVAARRTRDKLSRAFARGLANVVNVFDPQSVLLGRGLWRDLWPALSDDVLPWVDRLVMPAMREGLEVRTAGLGADSTVWGAAELAFTELLADPLGRPSSGVAV
ncbi:putative NBD/HSP70 family sugar kinase [Kineococcus xinjiangensis]|uniref:Putative NBD/HSP70 family sugar kinase n=1 Tax=Kineococcus xinjiangensis TaxID=512762 RepID=A0A2S6IPI8_9ACTN|nr:ROK family transcriptional regulator [Kineococcus xinjiangensis]PPK96091.1 putative NBD/HSP70 family sugar kinase [Kineococcus xinjiangensis]